MYSIVKTIEKNGPAIVAIPSIWVKDGHLYWPRDNRNLRKLRRKQAVPEETWEKLNCEIKKHGITTWDEALHLEKMLCKVETENEEDVLTRHTDQKKSFIQKNFDSSIRNIAASAVSENSSTSIVSAKKSLKRKSPEDEAHDSVEHRAKQSKLSQKSQFSVNGNLQDCDTEDHNRINLVSRDSHAEYSSDSTDTSPKAQNSPVSSFSFSDKEEISVKNANDIILAIANLTKGQARIETKLDHYSVLGVGGLYLHTINYHDEEFINREALDADSVMVVSNKRISFQLTISPTGKSVLMYKTLRHQYLGQLA
uniref:Uncharacterized protein n=1 Tax=Lutzomyia longipalpis TaxID=7200 RepID=A0A1B0CRZ6_LUTLO